MQLSCFDWNAGKSRILITQYLVHADTGPNLSEVQDCAHGEHVDYNKKAHDIHGPFQLMSQFMVPKLPAFGATWRISKQVKFMPNKIRDLGATYEKSARVNLKKTEIFLTKSQNKWNFPTARFSGLRSKDGSDSSEQVRLLSLRAAARRLAWEYPSSAKILSRKYWLPAAAQLLLMS